MEAMSKYAVQSSIETTVGEQKLDNDNSIEVKIVLYVNRARK